MDSITENAVQAIFAAGVLGMLGEQAGATYLRLCQCTSADVEEPLNTKLGNYHDIFDGFTNPGGLATLTGYEEGATDYWRSGDLVAQDLFDTTSSTIFYGIADEKDAEDDMPAVDFSRSTAIGDSGLFILTLTLPSGTSIALTGAGV